MAALLLPFLYFLIIVVKFGHYVIILPFSNFYQIKKKQFTQNVLIIQGRNKIAIRSKHAGPQMDNHSCSYNLTSC